MTRHHTTRIEVLGPWSLETSRRFWEEFTPAALAEQGADGALRTTFCVDGDWQPVEVRVTQEDDTALVECRGAGDLDVAAQQVARMLAIDIDGNDWPTVGRRDKIIGDAQRRLPGMRPCGFHSPYEAAAWSVLSQRIRMIQAANLRQQIAEQHGIGGAFPAPAALRDAELDLPGRKAEYLQAVAEAALAGRLDGAALRALDPAEAVAQVREIKGLGPFAADLVVIRGANAPDAVPGSERRLEAEVKERYGEDAVLADVAEAWRPYRTWAAVHLRSLAEQR